MLRVILPVGYFYFQMEAALFFDPPWCRLSLIWQDYKYQCFQNWLMRHVLHFFKTKRSWSKVEEMLKSRGREILKSINVLMFSCRILFLRPINVMICSLLGKGTACERSLFFEKKESLISSSTVLHCAKSVSKRRNSTKFQAILVTHDRVALRS